MEKNALIFGSAPCGSWEFLKREKFDLVVAADGGLHLAREAGFQPDFYVGDGDSGGAPEDGMLAAVLPEEKDVTDLEAACLWAAEQGCTAITLTGCTGGRLDHELAAIGLLEAMAERGVRVTLLDERNLILLYGPGNHRLERCGYRYFSLLPLDRTASGVTLRGAKYGLERATLHRGSSLSVSNEWIGDRAAELTFEDGRLLVIRSR